MIIRIGTAKAGATKAAEVAGDALGEASKAAKNVAAAGATKAAEVAGDAKEKVRCAKFQIINITPLFRNEFLFNY